MKYWHITTLTDRQKIIWISKIDLNIYENSAYDKSGISDQLDGDVNNKSSDNCLAIWGKS